MNGVPEIVPLDDGELLGEWEVIHTPGHDPGHICLWRERDGTLLCGDLLLPGFTPNIQPAPGHDDTLQEFLDSLDRVAALPVRLVLPAHGEPYTDAAGRARELARHHRERLAAICGLIAVSHGPPRSSRAACSAISPTPATGCWRRWRPSRTCDTWTVTDRPSRPSMAGGRRECGD